MKANEAPEKIFLEKEKETNRIHHLWGRTPVVSSLYEHIEYTRTDAFIKKASFWIECNLSDRPIEDRKFWVEDFVNYMRGE